ncbi:galactokinase [candidate division KSB1 bacterium]|nr:galactokinase [candidate division KSB1 bacterium]RQW06715.1 MAG: galactokinase [candidate division KSB1 bacterium]
MIVDRKQFIKKFEHHFSGEPRVFCAPGRVNLIGEHTDYNDGYVFPMAIGFYTTVAVFPTRDRKLYIRSENMHELIAIDLDANAEKRHHWSDYVAGMAHVLEKEGIRLPGASMLIESDVPVGAGLSSSAALEMSSGLALLSTVGGELTGEKLALLGQKAENQFVGMNCGIMDQFISMHGKENHALFLDCRTLDYELVPLPAENIRIVICNTMVKHELGSSEYNKRRAECEKGVEILRADYPGIRALRDVSLSQFQKVQHKLPDVVQKRCRHVISEDERALESIAALQAGDIEKFGQLMNASHDSLRDDYEVSCLELDLLVEVARYQEGCLGARMTGGGFGGCTVNLVASDKVDVFVDAVGEAYQRATNLKSDIYISVPSRGAHEMR